MPANFESRIAHYRERVASKLDEVLPAASAAPRRLHEAMRYAVFNGGKRVRPLLVYASGECLGVPKQQLDAPAAAIELIHAFSLVHDDLPAMDDDDLRRGRPTCHRAFDEATAILAGDALQALAFEVLAEELGGDPERRLQIVHSVAEACGSTGMAGGQVGGEAVSVELFELRFSAGREDRLVEKAASPRYQRRERCALTKVSWARSSASS